MRRALFLICLAVFACDKEKPKPDDSKKAEATPVPSGLVFNDFIPATGGGSVGLGVRDAGLEGGLAGVGGGAAEGAGDEPAAGGNAESPVKVTDPGAEPRAVRKYAFVANKVDKRILTVTQGMTQTMAGQPSRGGEATLKISLELTPKAVKPTGATIEAKVVKVEVPGAPPAEAQALSSLTGVSASFDISPQGAVGELSFGSSPAMKNRNAQAILQAISQSSQLLVTPLPTAPVGVGAKWEIVTPASPEQPSAQMNRFTLKEVSADGGVVEVMIEGKIPRRQAQDPQTGLPVTVEGDTKGKYLQQLKFNQLAPHAEGELTRTQKAEISQGGAKQQVLVVEKSKEVIETPK